MVPADHHGSSDYWICLVSDINRLAIMRFVI